MNKRILYLTLKRHWFDEIYSGRKKNEYRDMTDYWSKRLLGRVYDEIHFRNGYTESCPWMRVQWLGIKSDTANKMFDIELGEILETKNYE